MRRIVLFFGRLILLIASIAAIVVLARLAIAGFNDIRERSDAARVYGEHSSQFPAAATDIALRNGEISLAMTNAPSATPSPTETSDVPTVVPTDTPTITPTTPPTELPTNTATNTAPPTSTIPPTITKAVIAPPATNTKRAVAAVATTAIAVIESPAPTSTNVPTQAPVPSATQTIAPTIAPTDIPTIAATRKLPTIVLPAARTERPQVTAIPSPAVRLKSNGQDIMNIMLIGSDADVDPSDPAYRTDSMVIVSINRTTNSVSMLSIPRDLFVYIPNLGMQRVNVAYQWGESVKWNPGGGWGLLQQTILWNTGIPVHYYARVSLLGFKQIVDTLNGVKVAVDCPIKDLRYQGKTNDQQTPVYEPFTLDPGYYTMDGSLALWYARMRHSSSDFDRNRRQQQILRAIWRTAKDQGVINKAPELWGQMTNIVQTNMQLQDVIGLVPMALSLSPGDVRSYYMFKGIEIQHWKTPAGEDVQIPDAEGFFRTINDFYTPPTGNRFGAQNVTVEVINGSGKPDFDSVAADRLAWEGFVPLTKGVGDTTDKTTVYDLTGNANPAALAALTKATNVKPAQVISQPDPNRTADFRIVLGSDYNSCTAPGFAK